MPENEKPFVRQTVTMVAKLFLASTTDGLTSNHNRRERI